MKTHFTPLKLWLWVGFISISVQGLIVLFFEINEVNINQFEFNHFYSNQLNYIEQDFKEDNKSYNVIVIGSSLIGHGIACLDELDTYLSSKPNIKLLKIWDPYDPLENFIDNNLIGQIIKINPDLVLFQTELAAISYKDWERQEENVLLKKMKNLVYINNTTFKYVLPFKKREEFNCFPIKKDFDIQTMVDTISFIPRERSVKKLKNLDYFTKALNQLNNAGIKSVLVDVPKQPRLKEIIYTNSFRKDLQVLLNIYKEKYGVEHWSYSGQPIYFRHFRDKSHLNKEGKNIYTKWLLDKIDKEI